MLLLNKLLAQNEIASSSIHEFGYLWLCCVIYPGKGRYPLPVSLEEQSNKCQRLKRDTRPSATAQIVSPV